MARAKDTAIIILKEGEDGFITHYYLWETSPPNPRFAQFESMISEVGTDQEELRISSDKTSLKSEFEAFIDNFFASGVA